MSDYLSTRGMPYLEGTNRYLRRIGTERSRDQIIGDSRYLDDLPPIAITEPWLMSLASSNEVRIHNLRAHAWNDTVVAELVEIRAKRAANRVNNGLGRPPRRTRGARKALRDLIHHDAVVRRIERQRREIRRWSTGMDSSRYGRRA